jgi:hypothetical protein
METRFANNLEFLEIIFPTRAFNIWRIHCEGNNQVREAECLEAIVGPSRSDRAKNTTPECVRTLSIHSLWELIECRGII